MPSGGSTTESVAAGPACPIARRLSMGWRAVHSRIGAGKMRWQDERSRCRAPECRRIQTQMCLASICPSSKSSCPIAHRQRRHGKARRVPLRSTLRLHEHASSGTPLLRDACMMLQGCLSVRQLWSCCTRTVASCSVSTSRAERCGSTSPVNGGAVRGVPGERRGCGYSRRPRACRSLGPCPARVS